MSYLLLLFVLLCLLLTSHARPLPRASECGVLVMEEDGVNIEHVGDNIVVTTSTRQYELPPCKVANLTHGPAWKAWAQYSNASKITNLYGAWTVPPAPVNQNDGQTLFYWNGVEPADTSAVLQPVLQWGVSAAGGGNYWAIASWLVSSIHPTIVSPLLTVESGDVIEGFNEYSSNGTWFISAAVQNKKNMTTSFSYKPTQAFTIAYEVLEAYTISECTDYPKVGVVSFNNIKVAAGGNVVAPEWQPETQQPITCKEHAKVLGPTQVDIYF